MKAILSVLLVLPVQALHAQVPELMTLHDPDGAVVNGDTILLQGSSQAFDIEAEVVAELNGTTTRTINLLRRELGVVPGSENHLFWNVNMYPPVASGAFPTWFATDPLLMSPQDTVVLHAFYRPNGTVGICCFRHVWYDVDVPSDSSWVVICFDAQPGNSVPELGAGPGVMVMPNPVAGDEVIVVHEYPNGVDGLQVVLYDALGARALVRPVPPGEARTRIATSGLASGLWFVVLERNGLERSTCRLVIAR